jgi:putative lipoic acid-binding regulatory protein
MAMICKFCGKEMKPGYDGLRDKNSSNGTYCSVSADHKHIAVPNPPYCIYCGCETKPTSGGLSDKNSSNGTYCGASPDHKHALA